MKVWQMKQMIRHRQGLPDGGTLKRFSKTRVVNPRPSLTRVESTERINRMNSLLKEGHSWDEVKELCGLL